MAVFGLTYRAGGIKASPGLQGLFPAAGTILLLSLLFAAACFWSRPQTAGCVRQERQPLLCGTDSGGSGAAEKPAQLDPVLYQIAVELTGKLVFDYDITQRTLRCSGRSLELFGLPELLCGAPERLTELLHPDCAQTFLGLARETMESGGTGCGIFQVRGADGYLWIRITQTVLADESGRPAHIVGLVEDITAWKEVELSCRRKAERDSLSGLYNKGTTEYLVSEFLENQTENKIHAMLVLDVDDFKRINDTRGHPAGDSVLARISENLRRLVRATDIVGRIGGDEFIVFLKDIGVRETAKSKAAEICRAFGGGWDGGIQCSVSVGIAMYPEHGGTFSDLYRHADTALYEAKSNGKNRCVCYGEELSSLREEQLKRKA